MKVSILMALCAIALAGCNKDPQQKIENARQEQTEARQEVAQQAAQGDADGVADAQQEVRQADQNMAQTIAEVARDKAEAQTKLAEEFRELQERVAKAKAKPAETDPAKAAEFNTNMAAVDANLAAAQTELNNFANASETAWKDPHDQVKASFDRLDESIDKVE